MSAVREVAAMQWTDNGIGGWMTWLDDLADGTTPVFSGGYTATVAGKAVKLASQDRPTGTVSYTSDRHAAGFTPLRGVGSTALDTQELVTGGRTRKTGTLHLDGSEGWATWTYSNGRGFAVTNILPSDTNAAYYMVNSAFVSSRYGTTIPFGIRFTIGIANRNIIIQWDISSYSLPSELSSWYDAENDTLDVAAFKTWLTSNPIDVAYALPTATTESATAQPLTTVAGLNAFYESAPTITGTPLALKYTGTDYSIPTISGQKYLSRVNGVESVVNGGTAIAVRGGRDRLINLTRWCGAGLEPSTADGFYALYPWMRGYDMPYMQGDLKGYNGTGIETVGFNLLNIDAPFYPTTNKEPSDVKPYVENQWFDGIGMTNDYWRPTYCVSSVADGVLSVAHNPSYPGNNYAVGYCMRIPYTTNGCQATFTVAGTLGNDAKVLVKYCDYNGMQISYTERLFLTAGSNSYSFVPPANAYWTLLCFQNNSDTPCQISNLCVHLRWAGYRDGDYEPYWSQTRSLPIAQHFPDGMMGNGTTWDSLRPNKSVHAWKKVEDMGELNWQYIEASKTFYTPHIADLWLETSHSADVLCELYTSVDMTRVNLPDMAIACIRSISVSQAHNIAVRDDRYTTVAQFKAAVAGKHLWYRLAEPITTPIEPPWSGVYRVSDFGLELSLPQNDRTNLLTSPLRAVIAYSTDFVRELATLPKNYMSMDSFDEMAASLQQFADISVTPTWDAANGKYGFAFAHVANTTQLGTSGATLQPGKTYAATTSSSAQYTLPDITVQNLSLDIVVQLTIGSTQPTDLFVDGDATAIAIAGTPTLTQGETWIMVCSWIPGLSKWVILPINTQE